MGDTLKLGKNFSLYAIGKLISMIGSGIQMVAIPLYILDVTGSGTLMGLFAMLSTIPAIVISPLSGAMGDQLDRKKIMIWTDVIRGLMILFLAFLAEIDQMTIVMLFSAQVLVSVNDSFFNAATQAMIPEIVEPDNLTKANSVIGGVNSFSMILGPALGGILYGFMGIEGVFLVNGISFVGSAISEMFLDYKPISSRLALKKVWPDIKYGMKIVLDFHALRQLIIYGGVINFMFLPFLVVLLPYVARQDIGFTSHQYGFLQSFWMLGVMIGNLILGAYYTKKSTAGVMKKGFFFMIFFNMIFAVVVYIYNQHFWELQLWEMFAALAFLLLVMGYFNAYINTPLMTNMQILVPAEVRARAFSIIMALFQSAVPIGMLVFGFMSDTVPVSYILFSMSIILFVSTIVFLRTARPEVFEPSLAND